MVLKTNRFIVALILLCTVSAAIAERDDQQVRNWTYEELVKHRGWDFKAAEVVVEEVAPNLYLLKGIGGNVIASVGDDGTLIVDNQFPEMVPKLIAAIEGVGGKSVDIVVNTHWHHDHADGNKVLGPAGAMLISQESSRAMMTTDNWVNLVREAYLYSAYPKEALPDATFEKTMQLHYNGETIALMHFGPAHTTGDAVVYFQNANIIHMGDVFFNNDRYPFIDVDNGGSLDGLIIFCQEVLDQTNKDTVYIPGHGPAADRSEIEKYVEMLKAVEKRLASIITESKNLSDIVRSNITREWDADYGDNFVFLNRAYESELREESFDKGDRGNQ
ncbi:MBL fold metallo-hydrolase [Porticoccaceae bacterium]|nr:MBL fold metallo-hydrolase [Porticoccaceae bacterium]